MRVIRDAGRRRTAISEPGNFVLKVVGLVALVFALAVPMKAQSFYGSILGIVMDTSGAVIANATVTVTNVATNELQTAQTDSGGKFSFVNLLPATYRVQVEKAGFRRFVYDQLGVEVGAVARVDAALQVGAATETVEVSTDQALLQSDSSTLSTEITGAEVQQMPLNGRNVLNLIALAPGVVPTGAAMGDTGLNQGTRTAGGAGWGNYEIGGSIQGQGGQYVDGVANNLLGGNIVALVPTQDAIQEFNVATSNAGADFGRFSGGVVNMTTRSGTNAFHGSVWEYFRNRVLNANDYFSNAAGLARPVYNQDQFGASVSGPIRRDKAFFMFTWEGFRNLTGNLTPTVVPTVALQNGVFNTATSPITDPLGICSIKPYTGQTVNGQTFASGGYYIANLYQAGLVAGTTCGDPTTKIIKTFYPAPNASVNGNNWLLTTPLSNSQNQYNGRVDYTVSQKQRLFGRYTFWTVSDNGHSEFLDQGFGGTTWPTNDGHAMYNTHQAVIGDTYTFNPSTVMDVRVNYVRQYAPNLAQGTSVNEAQFGSAYGTLANSMNVHLQPGLQLNGGHGFYNMNNYPNDGITWYNTYGISASLVKILGSHSLKFGTELREMDESLQSYNSQNSGSLQFNTNYTGDEWASLLMGYPSSVTFKSSAQVSMYTYYQAYYLSDTWQATRNLTLNLGLRYEVPGAISERNNKAVVLLPYTVDPLTGVKGTESLVTSSLYGGRSLTVPHDNLFAPRVGFAYRVGANTAVRGGYGISYLPNDLIASSSSGAYINAATLATTVAGNLTPAQLQSNTLQAILNADAATGIPAPPGRGNGQPTYFMPKLVSTTAFLNQNISAPYPYQKYPYTQQWNVALSHQFQGNSMVEVSYSGLKGTNLPGIIPGTGSNLNQLPDQFDSLQSALSTKQVCAAAPNLPTTSSGEITQGQCLRPYPLYNNVNDTAQSTAVQHYRSFQVRAEKRMGAGGTLMGNYTWSQNTGNTDTQASYLESKGTTQGGNGDGTVQDYTNLPGEISLISYDVTNRAIVAYVLNLPFGHGQKFGNNLNAPLNALASGWAFNGITTFQSGFPIFLQNASNNQLASSYGAGVTRPMVVPGCIKKIGGSGLDRVKAGAWFNVNCFVEQGQITLPNGSADPFQGTQYFNGYAFGNEPRVDSILRADGIKNFDFSFQKSTPVHESANVEFRAEFFNVMNRVQFAPPIPSVGSPQFGTVGYQVNHPRQIQLSLRLNY